MIAGEPEVGPPYQADVLDELDPETWLPFARQFGYGYAHNRRLAAAAAGLPPSRQPNLEHADRLRGVARRDYFVALYGERFPEGQPVDNDELFPPDDPSAGCYGLAVGTHRPNARLTGRARAEHEAASAPQADDDAVRAARAAWAECMKARGIAVRDRGEAVRVASGDGAGAVAAAGAVGSGPGTEVEVRRGGDVVRVQVPTLDQGAPEGERRMATVDAECDAAVGLAGAARRVRDRAQNAFIARWREALVDAGVLPAPAAP